MRLICNTRKLKGHIQGPGQTFSEMPQLKLVTHERKVKKGDE